MNEAAEMRDVKGATGDGRHPRSSIDYEEIARLPLPGMALPTEVAFAPGERILTYLYSPSGELDQRLFALDLSVLPGDPVEVAIEGGAKGEGAMSLEEQLRRERARQVGLGITSATWAEKADALLVPLPDGVRVVAGLSADPRAPRVTKVIDAAEGEIVAPRLSPDGKRIAFVRDGDVHVAEVTSDATTVRLTSSATDGLVNGLAEYVAQEEMERPDGLWWSKDCRHIAYAEVDERHVPIYRIVHQGSDGTGPGNEEDHRYPFAGKENAVVRLGVVPAEGGETVWMDLGGDEQYLARVHWLTSGRLVAEIQPRDQTQLEVAAFDPATGAKTVLHVETSDEYVNLHDDFSELPSGEWLWSSERSGFRHLEVRAADGSLVRVLTAGEWQVDGLEVVDEGAGIVYFTGTRDGATERHLYAVPLEGGEIRRLTGEAGTHVVTVAAAGGMFVDAHGSLATPPRVQLRAVPASAADGTGAVLATLHDRRDPRIDELALEPPELVSLVADDGTELFGLHYRPETEEGTAPPLVVQVYGGPHLQLVVDDWRPTVAMRAQALRRLGFAVLVVDNRGSDRRGTAFERAIWRRMGDVEVADQVAGVRAAVAAGSADPERVGVFGWSYGGYMTLQCLMRAPDTFRAGVAGAPVTHWDGYDTHYTERYMGTPDSNPEGYSDSSPFARVESLRGDLMIVHGLIDENVHFRHTARLVNRLIEARKAYDLLCFPSERHLPRKPADRAHMERQVIEWLVAKLAT